ncbi:HNH endonuclease family protein [Marinobacterium marinum]|uniref:TIGR02646 family protein n=1 Tax=Marinobacterium marinum TaxID=2756129 RepID=A0A7W1WVG6_9GAMM|nr:hypothetical protein [Marinobacterium marinum]MBA4500888.1 hypothetical protein [Marinobacterium marinum]
MIPVKLQPEPESFDEEVRQPGLAWLDKKGIDLQSAPPEPSKLPAYWQKTNEQLWEAYSGVCAYLAIYFEWVSGASSTDHFIPKSALAGDAYEWSNYRLSCLGPNRSKNAFTDLLDPFEIQPDTFVLNLASGAIKLNPELDNAVAEVAATTISRLNLDSEQHRKMRSRAFTRYLRRKDEESLKELSPFVWYEANRQGLL